MRVFLDANILFSAADPKSATRALLDLLRPHAEILTSPHASEEAMRNIIAKRDQFQKPLAALLLSIPITHAFAPDLASDLPAEDKPILAAAVGSRCTHLWTGDKRHFGQYFGRLLHGVRIVSGPMLLGAISQRGIKE